MANIPGYKPRGNYLHLLADVVADRIMGDRKFDRAAERSADVSATTRFRRTWTPAKLRLPRKALHGFPVQQARPTGREFPASPKATGF